MNRTAGLGVLLAFVIPMLAGSGGILDEEVEIDLGSDVELDFGEEEELLNYDGRYSQNSKKLTATPRVSINQPNGTVKVHCTDTESIRAALEFFVKGSTPDPTKSYGDGIRLRVTGAGSSGSVRVYFPSRPSAVKEVSTSLSVQVPKGSTLSVHSSRDYAQVFNCASSSITVSSGANGAYVSGQYKSFKVSAATGDVTVVLEEDSGLSRSSSIAAPKGAVKLVLPLSESARLDARGQSVNVTQSITGGNVGEKTATASIGDGGPSLVIRAGGAIEISSTE